MSSNSRYLVGIDLGTSNSAVFYVDHEDVTRNLKHFLVPQWIGEGQIHTLPVLPSCLYFPTENEINSGQFNSPWETESLPIIKWCKTYAQMAIHTKIIKRFCFFRLKIFNSSLLDKHRGKIQFCYRSRKWFRQGHS